MPQAVSDAQTEPPITARRNSGEWRAQQDDSLNKRRPTALNLSWGLLRVKVSAYRLSKARGDWLHSALKTASEAHNRDYILMVLPKRSSGEQRLQ